MNVTKKKNITLRTFEGTETPAKRTPPTRLGSGLTVSTLDVAVDILGMRAGFTTLPRDDVSSSFEAQRTGTVPQ